MSIFKNIISAINGKGWTSIKEDAEPDDIVKAINESKSLAEVKTDLQADFDTQLASVKAENDKTVTALNEQIKSAAAGYEKQVEDLNTAAKENETAVTTALNDMRKELADFKTETGKEINALKGLKPTASNTLPIPETAEKTDPKKKVVKSEQLSNMLNDIVVGKN